MNSNRTIPRGLDYLTTIRSDQYIELSPELLGPGMERFSETVTLVGIPLNPPVGNADTIMERLEDGEPGREIPTRLVAFANMSAAPIKLEGTGPMAGYYDLYVTLSPTQPSPGRTTYHSRDGSGGTFESVATFWPQFELRPLGSGRSIFVDTGTMPVPGFPMSIGSAGGTWSLNPPTEAAVGAASPPASRGGLGLAIAAAGVVGLVAGVLVGRSMGTTAGVVAGVVAAGLAFAAARFLAPGAAGGVQRDARPGSSPFFYTGEVIITARRAGQDSARIPMLGGGETIAKCAKIQAEFTSRANAGRLGRIDLGVLRPFTNPLAGGRA